MIRHGLLILLLALSWQVTACSDLGTEGDLGAANEPVAPATPQDAVGAPVDVATTPTEDVAPREPRRRDLPPSVAFRRLDLATGGVGRIVESGGAEFLDEKQLVIPRSSPSDNNSFYVRDSRSILSSDILQACELPPVKRAFEASIKFDLNEPLWFCA